MTSQIPRHPARVLRFGAHVGRGVRRLAVDATLRGRRAFPRTIGDLTPESLSTITGRRVTSATVLDGASGTSSRARLALTGVDVPLAPGWPAAECRVPTVRTSIRSQAATWWRWRT